jgi:branched-chain amino acid transport system permease protein
MMDPILIPVLAQVVVSGLLQGTLYSLSACGLNLVFGVMGVINFAHGELMMLGAFVTFWLFATNIMDPVPSVLVSMALLFLLGALTQRFLLERISRSTELGPLLMTFGLSLLLVNAGLLAWSSDFRSVPYFSGSLRLLGLALPRSKLAAAGLAVLVTVAVYLFLRTSRTGKAIRATAENAPTALACGIDVRRIRILTFGLGAAMAGAAGSLVSTIYAFNPETGQLFILKAFAVVILGGLGQFAGAFVGGILLGMAEALAAFFTTAQQAEAVSYLILILVLLLRPSGLLGVKA